MSRAQRQILTSSKKRQLGRGKHGGRQGHCRPWSARSRRCARHPTSTIPTSSSRPHRSSSTSGHSAGSPTSIAQQGIGWLLVQPWAAKLQQRPRPAKGWPWASKGKAGQGQVVRIGEVAKLPPQPVAKQLPPLTARLLQLRAAGLAQPPRRAPPSPPAGPALAASGLPHHSQGGSILPPPCLLHRILLPLEVLRQFLIHLWGQWLYSGRIPLGLLADVCLPPLLLGILAPVL